jgi:hypothetical protein
METGQEITTAKRKRLLKTFGACPAGYTHDDLERFLDLLYGMFSDVYTTAFPPTVQRATTLLSTAKRRWEQGTLLFVHSSRF